MNITQKVKCSNCGSVATRRHFTSDRAIYAQCPHGRVMHTECFICDYLMVMCSLSGRVIEAYSSSTSGKTSKIQITPQLKKVSA